MSAHVAWSMKNGQSPKLTSFGPSNFEGETSSNFAKRNPKFLRVAHLSSTLWQSYQLSKICSMTSMTEMVMQLKNFRIISSFPLG
jgi:hypothetical protein